jgi:hypothetical protein
MALLASPLHMLVLRAAPEVCCIGTDYGCPIAALKSINSPLIVPLTDHTPASLCVLMTAGGMAVNGIQLEERDAVEMEGGSSGQDSSTISIEALDKGAHFLLIEMAKQ